MNSNPKVALITGAARRLGRAIVERLHQDGFRVIVHYRHSETEAKQLVAELNQQRPNSAVCIAADLSTVAACENLAQASAAVWKRLDCLVNNASSFYATKLGSVQLDVWRELMASNLEAPFFLSQACSPLLVQNSGNIINIIDYFGEVPLKNYPVYSIAKAGLAMLTKALALELGPNIRVNGVSPTVALWPEGTNELDADLKAKILDRTILKRPGGAVSIADTVSFLANKADYITGQIILVDGGRSILA